MKPAKMGVFLPAVLCTALWGSAIPAVKSGYVLFSIAGDAAAAKLFFAGCRFALAGLLVLAFVAARRNRLRPEPGAWPGILALSAAQTVMQYIFYYIGLSHTTGVRGSVLSATSTFFAVLAAHFAFADDRLTIRKGVGCLAGFAGVVVILSGAGLGGQGIRLTGEGFMLLSALGQGLGAGISRKITPGRDPMRLTGWQLTVGGLVLLAAGAIGGGAAGLTWSPAGVGLLLYLSLLSAVAFTVWTMLLKEHPVGKVTVYMFLIPVFGSLLSACILQEEVFTLRNLAALLLVCAGIAAVNYQGQKPADTAQHR